MDNSAVLVIIGALAGGVPSLIIAILQVISQNKERKEQRFNEWQHFQTELVMQDVQAVEHQVDKISSILRQMATINSPIGTRISKVLEDEFIHLHQLSSQAGWRLHALTPEIVEMHSQLIETFQDLRKKANQVWLWDIQREGLSDEELQIQIRDWLSSSNEHVKMFDEQAGKLRMSLRDYLTSVKSGLTNL